MKEPLNLNTLKGLDNSEREILLGNLIVEVHDWLSEPRFPDDATPIWEYSSTRAYMTDVVTLIRQLDLDRDLLLDATVVLRLAERATGKAVRHAQAAGELGSLGTNGPGHARLPSPAPYVGTGNTAYTIYKMVDGITDAQFSLALKEARIEGRLSRSTIARKVVELQTGKKKVDTRRDLVDTSRELAEQLRKVTLKLRNLRDDDRLERNKAEVAARMRPYLDNAVAVCTDLKKKLDEPSKDEGK